MDESERFDERSHETKRLAMKLRYGLAAIMVFSVGVSQMECNGPGDMADEYRSGRNQGRAEAMEEKFCESRR